MAGGNKTLAHSKTEIARRLALRARESATPVPKAGETTQTPAPIAQAADDDAPQTAPETQE